ncbi:MAG: hypothetical protein IMZ53_11725 [Thermoplasmata archaeon]|nr:hypothetical protein [Thermoplasmata archaeon]
MNNNIILNTFYGWDRGTQNYILSDMMSPGEGYWVYGYHDCDLWISSITKSDAPLITNLLVNWNLIGLPYDVPQVKGNLTVFYNDTEYSWDEAVTNGIVVGSIYGWNGIIQNYGLSDMISPGQGYWMYAYHSCSLKRGVS